VHVGIVFCHIEVPIGDITACGRRKVDFDSNHSGLDAFLKYSRRACGSPTVRLWTQIQIFTFFVFA
jgi:hypothetical protein